MLSPACLARGICSRLLIALALCLLVSIAPAAAEKRVALVIGNSAYTSLPRLETTRDDAELMADTLRALGFSLLGGRAQIDLDQAGFDNALKNFGEQLAGADVALFYYAGHGVQVRGANAMIPVDADAAKPETKPETKPEAKSETKQANVEARLIEVARVLTLMDGARTRFNLVILDASRPNPLQHALHTDAGLADMQPPPRTLISSAAQPSHVAREGDNGNSLYTRVLARQMLRPGLDVFQTFHEVDLAVKRATGGRQENRQDNKQDNKQDSRQEISVASSPIDGGFQFVPTPPAPSPAPRVVVPPLAQQQAPPLPSAQSGVFPAPVLPAPAPAVAAVVPPPLAQIPARAGVADPSAVLYEEDPAAPQGRRTAGTVTWRTEPLSDGSGLGLRAVVDVPERKLKLTLLLRRNGDAALPASHTADLGFTVPGDLYGGGIDSVPGVLMKTGEQAKGAPLAGLAVKVAENVFLLGLSNRAADVAKNLDLLQSREWIDIPMVFANKRRAILAIEKGAPGERAFTEAFAAWSQAAPPAPAATPAH